MKKNLLPLLMVASLGISLNVSAQRYNSEIFTDAQITLTPDIVYGNNFQFLTGAPVATDLKMDIYAPDAGVDPLQERPLIIYMHTGSFLPSIVNGTPTGSRKDSTVAEMCRQFARRGYVAAAMSYRLGWNPVATDQDVRTGTLLQAVYRSIQDAKACVRSMYKTAQTGNPYGIDTNAIILGGQGSGGYVALAYATLNDAAEIQLPKFLSNTTTGPPYNFVQGQSYVNTAILGDFDGHGGNPLANKDSNSLGYSTKVHFAFNMGGALGDSSWLEAGDIPMVAFHVMNDPFAPYGDGPVIVPTTQQFVVNVSGSATVISLANSYGNNNCFINAGFTDPYTVRANMLNGGKDGLFPFEMPPPPSAPGQAGPWEWFDSTAVVAAAQALGYPASQGTNVYMSGLITNPDMNKTKALGYIDTIQNYVNPRIVYCLGLNTAINETGITTADVIAQPNPASDRITVELRNTKDLITKVELTDIAGHHMMIRENIHQGKFILERNGLDAGIYILRLQTKYGNTSIRIVFN